MYFFPHLTQSNPYRRSLRTTSTLFGAVPPSPADGFTPVTFATTSSQAKLTPAVSQAIDTTSQPSVIPYTQSAPIPGKIFIYFSLSKNLPGVKPKT